MSDEDHQLLPPSQPASDALEEKKSDAKIPAHYRHVLDQYSALLKPDTTISGWERARWFWRFFWGDHILADTQAPTTPFSQRALEWLNPFDTNAGDRERWAQLVHYLGRKNPNWPAILATAENTQQLTDLLVKAFKDIERDKAESLEQQKYNFWKKETSLASQRYYFDAVLKNGAEETRKDMEGRIGVDKEACALVNHRLLKIREIIAAQQASDTKELDMLRDYINTECLLLGHGKRINRVEQNDEITYETQDAQSYTAEECAEKFKKLKYKTYFLAFLALLLTSGVGYGIYSGFNILLGGNTAWLLALFLSMPFVPAFYWLVKKFLNGQTNKSYEALLSEADQAAVELHNLYWKRMRRTGGTAFSVLVGLAEGGVIAFCVGNSFGVAAGLILGTLAFIGGVIVNIRLVRIDMIDVADRLNGKDDTEERSEKETEADAAKQAPSRVKNILMWALWLVGGAAIVFTCACTGAAYAGLSGAFNYNNGLQGFFSSHFHTAIPAAILAGVPVFFDGIGMFSIFFIVMIDFFKYKTWQNAKDYVHNLKLVWQSKHENRGKFLAVQLVKMLLVGGLTGYIGYLGLSLFGESAYTLFTSLGLVSASTIAEVAVVTNCISAVFFGFIMALRTFDPIGSNLVANIKPPENHHAAAAQKRTALESFHDSYATMQKVLEYSALAANTAGVTYLFYDPATDAAKHFSSPTNAGTAIGYGALTGAGLLSEATNSAPGNWNNMKKQHEESNAHTAPINAGFFSNTNTQEGTPAIQRSDMPFQQRIAFTLAAE